MVADACVTSAADIHTNLNPAARFGEYETFSVAGLEGSPTGYQTSPRTIETERRLVPLIEAGLKQKGYVEVPSNGDIVVAVGAGRRGYSVRETSSVTSSWLPEDETRDLVEGAIVIDAFDPKGRMFVWHGSGASERGPGEIDQRWLDRSVHEMLTEFPRAKGKAPIAPR